MRHTPGKWEFDGSIIRSLQTSPDGLHRKHTEICRMIGVESELLANSDANGTLIAAAPALLEALKAITGEGLSAELIIKINSAISAAEGRE